MKRIHPLFIGFFVCIQCVYSTLPKLLIKIPTRSRPEQFFSVLDLYYKKLSQQVPYTFLITCDEDDAQMNNAHVIEHFKKYPHLRVTFASNDSKVQAYNRDLENADFDIMVITSDDMIPMEQDYDKTIIDTMLRYFPNLDGVLNFNDGHLISQCNTMPIVCKKYFDRFGYIYHPSYKSLFCDVEFSIISRLLRKEKTSTITLIKHDHPYFDKRPYDDLYEKNNQYFQIDKKTYFNRIKDLFGISQAEVFALCPKRWSIIICSTAEYAAWEKEITSILTKQIHDAGIEDDIEILIDNTVTELRHKRNELSRESLGRYHNFIDPEMLISDDYITTIYNLLKQNPDIVVPSLGAENMLPPLHMCPMKRTIGLTFTFLEGYAGAEKHWEKMIKETGLMHIVTSTDKKVMSISKIRNQEALPKESCFVFSLPWSIMQCKEL